MSEDQMVALVRILLTGTCTCSVTYILPSYSFVIEFCLVVLSHKLCKFFLLPVRQHGEFCEYHIQAAYKKMRAQRMECQAG